MKLALSRKNIWDKLPRGAKSAVGRLLQVVPPAYLLGKRFRHNLQFVEQAQWWSAERGRDYQLAQLKRVCAWAAERSPFYGEHFESVGFDPRDIKSLDDLSTLPTIDKHTVREHLDRMCTVSPNASHVDYVTTGGSSGTPLGFYTSSHRSAIEYAYLISGWRRAGYDLGTPLAVFRGRVVPPDRNHFRHEYDPLLRHHYYSNFDMNDENMGRYLSHIGRIGPCFLHVYPSSVAALASFMRRAGVSMPPNVRGVLAESENVYPEQRAKVEETLPVRYFSAYGHTEKLVAAVECEHSTRYHVWPTYGICELLDDAGQAVTTVGAKGEIVGTGFINTVTPFIRYRTGDYAVLAGDTCERCGRHQMLLERIEGHNIQEMLVAADGSRISWTAVNMHDDTFDRVRQFQFYQDRPGVAQLRVVPADGFADADRSHLQRHLAAKLGGRIDFDVVVCEQIAPTPSGKAIYIDQRLATASSPEETLI